jgi:hypothetical protein
LPSRIRVETTFASAAPHVSGLKPMRHIAMPSHPPGGAVGEVCSYTAEAGWVGTPSTLPPNVYHQWPSIGPAARLCPPYGYSVRLPVRWLRKNVL